MDGGDSDGFIAQTKTILERLAAYARALGPITTLFKDSRRFIVLSVCPVLSSGTLSHASSDLTAVC